LSKLFIVASNGSYHTAVAILEKKLEGDTMLDRGRPQPSPAVKPDVLLKTGSEHMARAAKHVCVCGIDEDSGSLRNGGWSGAALGHIAEENPSLGVDLLARWSCPHPNLQLMTVRLHCHR